MPLNFELAGKTYPSSTEVISASSIEQYASASRIDNSQHLEGPDQAPSAIYPVVVGLPKMVAIATDPELQLDNPLMIVHGEEEIVHHRPMRPGETIVFTPSLDAVEDKGSGATYVAQVTGETPDGELVNEQRATIFVRGAGSGTKRASGPKPPTPSRGERVASFAKHVDEEMPADYAEASGDHNPIHLDPGVATAVGLPGVINHGLGTLSIVSGGLVDAVAGGDATRLTRISVRFTDMVIPGSDLDTEVFASDGDSFVFETTRPDGATVMVGVVEVAPV